MSLFIRLALVALLLPATAIASDPYVPDDLQDWQAWVLHDKDYRACPFLFDRTASKRDDYVCRWPGQLQLAVDAGGGRFNQTWSIYAEPQWLRLPGNVDYWPHAVTANGSAVAVVLRDNTPSVYLPPGNYRLAGTFEWDERPGNLAIPRQTGLISLTVDGQTVARPELSGHGVFLGERTQATQARDGVTAAVYRLVSDDVPTRLTTHVEIQVAGGVREELFGPILPDGFMPLTIDSNLPVRLEPDGKLRVQVRPGSWTVTLTARADAVLDKIARPAATNNLPPTEIWSYRSNDTLRVTAPEGLPPVDPLQVDVPGDWDELPAFRIGSDESLTITERSRGMVSTNNDLSLSRTMWLDFDRAGYMVSDEVMGVMRSDWRLDMVAPFRLLSATLDGDNLLITDGARDDLSGVEIRRPDVYLESIGRLEAGGTLPATGWESRFSSVETTLNLPPGHKLLAAPGVDQARGSWVSQWQLLDFFLVLIITISAWRLFGVKAGVIALLALVLSFHEINAPTWVWLNLLIAIALLRVAPAGRLRQTVRAYQFLSVALLVLTLLPFVAGQLRIALYPQLEAQNRSYGAPSEVYMDAYDVDAPEAELMDQASLEKRTMMMQREVAGRSMAAKEPASAVEEIVVTASSIGNNYARYAANAIVQAGAGVPAWQWNSYYLSWSGPVDAEQAMRLVILPRWLVSTLRVIESLVLLLFAAVLAAEILNRRIDLPGGLSLGTSAASSVVVVALLGALLGVSQPVHAQMPDAEILRELEARLLEAPECVPRCAEIVAADIDVSGDAVRMTLSIHALEDIAIPLPGSDAGWRPTAILRAGAAASQVTRGPGQALWIRLAAGRHTVTLSGPIPPVDSVEIPFPTPPRVVAASADGWFISGVKDRRLLSGSLQLTRLQAEADGSSTQRWESSRFPPFVRVTRTISLDLDWQVTTRVQRIAPVQGVLTLELPLVDGESVISDNATIRDDKILVTMAPTVDSYSWRSNLERRSSLSLLAAPGRPWQEVWAVAAGPTWHTDFAGVPESEIDASLNVRVATFYPRSGETLDISATRPEGSAGNTLAFDAVDLYTSHGDRSSDTTMSLEYRSTRGKQHVVQLPEAAELLSVNIDGERHPLQAENSQLVLPILPGEHDVEIVWRTAGAVGTRAATPAVDIGAPASNISLRVELPRDRWLLGTLGPRLGPAVLYWSEIIVLILAAIILGRTSLAPLKTRHWLLLGLGFSLFAWQALAIVVVWLLASGAREKWNGETSWWQFNLVQSLFAGLTVIALLTIASQLPDGLLGLPDMHVTGNGSNGNSLQWFADQSASALPVASAFSVPLWVYKVFILGWSLWLSFALLRWLPWVWRCFASQGYWRSRDRLVRAQAESEE